MKLRILLQLAVILTVATACTAKTAPGTPMQRNMLSEPEMLKAGYPDAFTTVQTLRPHWMQRRGSTSLRGGGESIKVYLDGALMGSVEALKQITTRSIFSIRYLDGIEASQRWGLDHGAGAIVVSTRKT